MQVGTLDYMAPELVVRHSRFFTADHVVDPGKHPLPFAQALKSPVTTKADVWCAAALSARNRLARKARRSHAGAPQRLLSLAVPCHARRSLGVALHALALQRYPVTLSTFKVRCAAAGLPSCCGQQAT